jgi:phage tail-like protein
MLPALYQADEVAQGFTAGLDDVLAPVLCVLDCLEAYVDPWLAPEDFVAWFESWLGLEPDENVPMARRRARVAETAQAYRWYGTARGLRAAIRAVSGIDPEIEDTGGVEWSATPGAAPRTGAPHVDVFVPAAAGADLRVIDATVAAAKPAHVGHSVTTERPPR